MGYFQSPLQLRMAALDGMSIASLDAAQLWVAEIARRGIFF